MNVNFINVNEDVPEVTGKFVKVVKGLWGEDKYFIVLSHVNGKDQEAFVNCNKAMLSLLRGAKELVHKDAEVTIRFKGREKVKKSNRKVKVYELEIDGVILKPDPFAEIPIEEL